jgi:DTW domain-containing protein YfiP
MPHHAVSRLRSARLARSVKPFLARGGPKGERCAGCRLILSHCMCALRHSVPTKAGMCLLMADIEPLKPSNTGWLIADVVPNTFAFGWARTEVDPALLHLLADPQWQGYVVFPGEFVAPERVVNQVQHDHARRPLFIMLDGTWAEARKMFHKSPYLNPEQMSRYTLRRSKRDDHFCTAEVGAMCLELAQDTHAAETLNAYLDVYTEHYLKAKHQQAVDLDDAVHRGLRALR